MHAGLRQAHMYVSSVIVHGGLGYGLHPFDE